MEDKKTPLQRPATRAARLSAIEEMLLHHIVTSQSQLSDMLSDEGIDVTQATLSRDLEEINATKTRLENGTVAYVLGYGQSTTPKSAQQQMSRILSGLVTSVASARNLAVIHTPSGAAQYVASVMDRQSLDDVLGTIAGDDTVLIICKDDQSAATRAKWLLSIASSNSQQSAD
ncbi:MULTISPECIES: arginine repressor [Bifidobacterium]|jgi:transcriptional regulator of arginine metabolism|uniref:Arginine repressor n=3 Tax=Bifidobacterium TaxID=1678 RepID=M4RER5_9BIFI|nr:MULTISPECIES: arginine repressor [Bifidobacterium]AGH42026.1 arginine repressor [Bifidobacterium thermophilum RBL67]MBM6980942.1 arginine repressor [Bifidobacterium thermophilum]MDW8486589.1 arginine repressor [Bifidobacterium thermophilum]NME62334.1 arginine repressor [Bifidobacterium thermophilum]PKU88240.1 arginine repressor [Bifidobacterium thermophilum]